MRRNSLFWGAILVLLGFLLLLNSLGILRVNVWNLLWPVFLIALGLWVLFGTLFRPKQEVEHANVPLEGASRARLQVRHGAGRLNIHGGTQPNDLAEGDFGGGLDLNTRRNGDLLDVRMSVPVQVFPSFIGPGYTLDWTFGLARGIPISLDLETGASESHIDLSELLVSDVRLKTGASSNEVTLPANAGFTRMRAESGAASLVVRIPAGVAASIRAVGGLASIHVDPSRFPRMGDTYQSPDFNTAANKVDLDIQTGVGSVEIR